MHTHIDAHTQWLIVLHVCHRRFLAFIEVLFGVLEAKPEADWYTVHFLCLCPPPPLLSPLKACEFIRLMLAYTAFPPYHILFSISQPLTVHKPH